MQPQQVLGLVERDDAALLQHGHAPAQRLGLLEIMRGQHDGVAVAVEAPDEAPQRLAQFDIDAGGRLVEHDHRRLVHQRLRDQHAALHAAGQRAHVGVRLAGQVEVLHHLVDPRAVVAQAEVARLHGQRFAHREERVEHQLLRHHAQRAACGAVIAADVVAHDARRAAIRAHQSRENADQRGLAGAIGAEQPEKLTAFDAEADAGQRLQAAVTLGDVADFDRVGHWLPVGAPRQRRRA